MNFGHVFIKSLYIKLENFPDDGNNSFTVIRILFKYAGILKNVKNKLKFFFKLVWILMNQ